jgi:hypothetical protein
MDTHVYQQVDIIDLISDDLHDEMQSLEYHCVSSEEVYGYPSCTQIVCIFQGPYDKQGSAYRVLKHALGKLACVYRLCNTSVETVFAYNM